MLDSMENPLLNNDIAHFMLYINDHLQCPSYQTNLKCSQDTNRCMRHK